MEERAVQRMASIPLYFIATFVPSPPTHTKALCAAGRSADSYQIYYNKGCLKIHQEIFALPPGAMIKNTKIIVYSNISE